MTSSAPTFTDKEVLKYLRRINFPVSNSSSFPSADFETLRHLVACHASAVPFENLALHYSNDPQIPLDKDHLFDKFVNRHRGGYCMEQNRCFSILLRSLGYDLYTIGARVYTGHGYGGWNHMAIIVTLDETEYLVDVGFGGHGLTQPLPIFKNGPIENPVSGAAPEEYRAHYAEMPINSKKGHKVWFLELRWNSEAKWQPIYMFEKDLEFYYEDYEV
jgi:arylamine N-acetyltransferase